VKESEGIAATPKNDNHDELMRLIYQEEVPTFSATEARACLDVLQEDNEGTLPLITRLLSAGTHSGRERVKYLVRSALRHVHVQYKTSHLNLDWKLNCGNALSPRLSEQIIRNWNISNVLEETEDAAEFGQTLRDVGASHDYFGWTDYPFKGETASDEYWRGLTALKLTGVEFRPAPDRRARARVRDEYSFHEKSFEFIRFAGEHDDIQIVTKTAKERQTIDVATLRECISGDSGVPAVSAGAL
jgi:hypothetical protein